MAAIPLLLGDFDDFGLTSSGAYPTELTNADGDKVCVAQAWQYSQVVGELNVQWNADGVVESCVGVPHLLLGDDIVREDGGGNEYTPEGAELQAIMDAVESAPQLSIVTEDATVANAPPITPSNWTPSAMRWWVPQPKTSAWSAFPARAPAVCPAVQARQERVG